jgi:hypothetical protein
VDSHAGVQRGGVRRRDDCCGGSDLHNSWVAIALRLGIPTYLLVIAYQVSVLWYGRRLAAAGDDLAVWLVACQVLVSVARTRAHPAARSTHGVRLKRASLHAPKGSLPRPVILAH